MVREKPEKGLPVISTEFGELLHTCRTRIFVDEEVLKILV